MTVKRLIDKEAKTIRIEFTDGQTFGPITLNAETDALTRMIGILEGRIATLEGR